MKRLSFFLLLLLIMNCRVSLLHGQSEMRDSLIDESLMDFFSEHIDLPRGTLTCRIAAHTFPYDYDLSMWDDEYRIDIANLKDKKTKKKYERTKQGIPTIYLIWGIDQEGFLIFKVVLYYVKLRRKTIDYAISDTCTYYYKYSDSEKRWMLASKSCNGV